MGTSVEPTAGTKLCSRCTEAKPYSAFTKGSHAPYGLAYWCKVCCAESGKREKKKNRASYVPYTPEELVTRTKLCSSCGKEKAYGKFYVQKNLKDGLSCYCKSCSKAKGKKNQRKWRTENPEKMAARNKKRQQDGLEKAGRHWKEYGIDFTPEEYEERLALQGNRCCLCGRPASDFKKRLCVDHNHDTGQVRGITCNYCNTVIGIIEGKQDLVKRVEEYLGVWNGMSV